MGETPFWRRYLRLWGSDPAADVEDELGFHLSMRVEDLIRQGRAPAEARAQAEREFGDVQRIRGEMNEIGRKRLKREGRAEWWGSVRQDLRFALRTARRSPGFAAVAILTLALGIGATTAIFTVVRQVLLRDLPFADPDRLVAAWAADPGHDQPHGMLAVPEFEEWRAQGAAFAGMAAYSALPTGLTLAEGGEPVRLRTAYVSADFFSTLGLHARVGRVILPAEHVPGRDRVVVLSYGLWRSRFGGDPGIVGRTLRLNDEPFTVVGVLPPDARFPGGDTEAWTPLTVVPESGIPRVWGVRWLNVVARLRPGVTVERARSDLAMVARRLEAEHRESNEGWSGATLVSLRDDIVGGVRGRLLVIFGAVLLVLVLACVNLANLVLARSSLRMRELSIRSALGAGRARLARQLLTESVVLALVGGALGVALAWWGAGALLALDADWQRLAGPVRMDWMVLAFALLLSALTGLGFGLIPATQRLEGIAETLRESARGTSAGARAHTLRSTLVALEVGLAVVLVAGAALLAESFVRLSRVELGFDADHTLYARITIPSSRYPTAEQYLPVAERMLAAVGRVPGVTEAAEIKDAPLRGAGERSYFEVPAHPARSADEQPVASYLPVSPGYFRTMGIPLKAGRDLTPQDGDEAAAGVVVSETLARSNWPTGAVGEEIVVGKTRARVVGVVGDARYTKVDDAATPVVYLPQRLMTRIIVTIVARTPGDPAVLLPAVRAAIRSVEPDQPITEIGTMRAAVSQALAAPRFLTLLVGLFGVLALVLATVGVYGVVAYVVGRRTNEIGIRMALGAGSREIVAWTLRTGMAPVLVGLASGLVAALALSGVLAAQLYEVSPGDPAILAAVTALLAGVSLLASGVPALRAARLDPVEALREP